MPKMELKESNFALIPDGEVLTAEVKNVEQKVVPWKDDDGNEIQRIEFEFFITDDQFTGRRMWGSTPTTFTDNPDCKLRAWVQELLGEDSLPSGFVLDTDELIGLPCRVEVAQKTNKKGDIRNQVDDVIRAKANKFAAPKSGTDDGDII